MREYSPDCWVLIQITPDDPTLKSHKRIFACWYGGFAGSDSWKLSSGNEEVIESESTWEVKQNSGSLYIVPKLSGYRTNMYGESVLKDFISKAPANGYTITILDQPKSKEDLL